MIKVAIVFGIIVLENENFLPFLITLMMSALIGFEHKNSHTRVKVQLLK